MELEFMAADGEGVANRLIDGSYNVSGLGQGPRSGVVSVCCCKKGQRFDALEKATAFRYVGFDENRSNTPERRWPTCKLPSTPTN